MTWEYESPCQQEETKRPKKGGKDEESPASPSEKKGKREREPRGVDRKGLRAAGRGNKPNQTALGSGGDEKKVCLLILAKVKVVRGGFQAQCDHLIGERLTKLITKALGYRKEDGQKNKARGPNKNTRNWTKRNPWAKKRPPTLRNVQALDPCGFCAGNIRTVVQNANRGGT